MRPIAAPGWTQVEAVVIAAVAVMVAAVAELTERLAEVEGAHE